MKVVDTTFLIDYYRERDAIEQYLDAHDEETIAASTITFGELAVGEIMARSETKREILADLGWLDVRAFTIEHAYDAAAIEADLRDRGEYRATSANDIEIGGTARALGVPIVTRNVEDFERFDGVVVETY